MLMLCWSCERPPPDAGRASGRKQWRALSWRKFFGNIFFCCHLVFLSLCELLPVLPAEAEADECDLDYFLGIFISIFAVTSASAGQSKNVFRYMKVKKKPNQSRRRSLPLSPSYLIWGGYIWPDAGSPGRCDCLLNVLLAKFD